MFWPHDSLKFVADYLINLFLLKSCLFRGEHQHPITYMVTKHDSTHIIGKIISTFCSFTGSPTQTHTYWSCNISLRTKSIHSKHIMYISYSVVALTYGITNSSVWGSQTPSVQAQRLGFSSFHSWQVQRDSAVTPTASIKQTLAQLPCLVKEIAWEVKRALLVAGLLEAVLNLCDAAAVFQGQSDNLTIYTNLFGKPIWRCPEIGVLQIQSIFGFSNINHAAIGVTPMS